MNMRITVSSGLISALVLTATLQAAPTEDYQAIPPFLEVNSPAPNVLVVLDNSNSMDENVTGEAVGSNDVTSRSEIARNALKSMITEFGGQMRFGLMAYRQSNIQSRHIHNSFFYLSHDSATYDPAGPFTSRDSASNTQSSDINGHTIYYDQALPFYAGSNQGNRLCYSTNFLPRPDPTPPVTDINQNISLDNSYTCCTGKTGNLDITPDGINNDAAAIAEHTGTCNTYNFNLTDSDVAGGFWQLGEHYGWNHVGTACLSTSTPGGGYLHVPIADSSTAHTAAIDSVLGTWNGDCSTDTPLRNAGLTPLASTLASARDYFADSLSSGNNGGPQSTPVQYECQRNFVLLITDGLPTEDLDGDGERIDDAVEKAAALRSLDVTVNSETVNCDVQTFVLGFALPRGQEGALDPIAVAGGTSIDTNGDSIGEAYYAGTETDLVVELRKVLNEMLNRTSSGTATAINLNSYRGEGMAVRATFRPMMTDPTRRVAWTGHLNALFVDDAGNLREDRGTAGVLQNPTTDRYVDMCYNETQELVRVKLSTTEGNRPTRAQSLACAIGTFGSSLDDVSYLWDAGQWLADIAASDIPDQRGYTSTDAERYIFTNIDTDKDGVVDAGESVDFVAASFTDTNAGLLQASDLTEAAAIVNQIRGADQAGMRSRQITVAGSTKTWRLGDIVYSSPTSVGRPSEAFDLLYKDAGYGAFFDAYKNRRQVVYVGANDGMLHAFNAGHFNFDTLTFSKGYTGDTQYDLGAEIWAFVPYNGLAHLKYLTDPSYGSTDGDHIYSVDQQPRVFDARIFGEDGVIGQANVTHTNGWGTVLVGGMRFGGGEITVDADITATTDNRTLRSSNFIFDVTDPDKPPKLLMEFTHPNLGYTTAVPAPIKVGDNWYLLFGSGPHPANATALGAASSDQAGRLFLINLKTMALETGFGTAGMLTLAQANSFASDLIAVDYNLDYSADSVYFGTVSGTTGNWSGNLQRIRIVDDETDSPWTYFGVSGWAASVLFNTARPITAMPSIALDSSLNRWIYAGSGRFLVQADVSDTTVQSFFGVKEPRDTSGAHTWGTATSLLDVSSGAVYQNSELVTGVSASAHDDSPCPAGTVDTFSELECFLRQYSYAGDYKNGWKRNLPRTRQRNINQASILGGTVTYTGYTPSDVVCEAEGKSDLFALYFGTGTAYREPIIGLGSTQNNGNRVINTMVELGQGLASSPSLHTGAGYEGNAEGRKTKAIVQTSTGTTYTIEQDNPFSIRPGEMNWREH